MKKVAIFLCCVLSGLVAYSADLNPIGDISADTPNAKTLEVISAEEVQEEYVLKGEVSFDWPSMTQVERDNEIEQYRLAVFEGENVLKYGKSDFKSQYKDYLKDKDYLDNYQAARIRLKETADANLSSFFIGERILYMYAIQYKKDPKTVYYYDPRGNLQYVDKISDNYPNYPYVSKQYRVNGKLVSAIYFLSKDIQHMYNPDETYKGLWYKEHMFDRKGVKTLTRTNW